MEIKNETQIEIVKPEQTIGEETVKKSENFLQIESESITTNSKEYTITTNSENEKLNLLGENGENFF